MYHTTLPCEGTDPVQLEMFDLPKPESVVDRALRVLGELKRWENEISVALAYSHDAYSLDDITNMIMRGEAVLYAYTDCFAICTVVLFPGFKNFHVFLAGGNLDSILARKAEFADYARQHGCKYLSCSGRPGWGRALSSAGWEHVFTTMYLEV